MGGLHEVGTHHGEGDAVAVLGGELHALLELVLKHRRVETASRKFPYSVTSSQQDSSNFLHSVHSNTVHAHFFRKHSAMHQLMHKDYSVTYISHNLCFIFTLISRVVLHSKVCTIM